MPTELPQVKHDYVHHHMDSTRWQRYTPRDDDIIVATPYKSGTTWMQAILMHLVFQDFAPRELWEFSRWLDFRHSSIDEVIDGFEAQEHRRCIKTHLPLDALPYFSQASYIVVGRDARDVFMSLWNHYVNYTDDFYERLNATGFPFPRCPDDIRDLWQMWMTRGWFEWESEGYPFWTNLRHTQTWWDFRHLPNILLVHFNDLLADLSGEIRRVADYLGIEVAEDTLARIVEAVTFANMKQNADAIMGDMSEGFRGGAQSFIHKGTNGRWRAVLTEDDLKLYEAAVARELTPDCARWLQRGRL